MGYQTEVNIGGPIVLPAAAGVVAVATTAAGRGVKWDSDNANLALCVVDDRVDFIIDEVNTADSEASVIPFTPDRNYRVRLAASLTGALALGKLIKVDDSGAGLFDLGGGAGDVSVGVCEEASVANGAALVRATSDTSVAELAAIADAVVAHDINATFSDTEVEAALDALGTKINLIIAALETHSIIAS